MKKLIYLTLIMCIGLSGCSMRLRQASDFPPQLHVLNFKSNNAYSQFTTLFRAQLKSMDVIFSDKAPYTLAITKTKFFHDTPNITSTSWSVAYKFHQYAHITILHKGKVVASRNFSAARSVTLNANQIYTTSLDSLTQQQLQRDITNQIFIWLNTQQTRDQLAGKTHAKHKATTTRRRT